MPPKINQSESSNKVSVDYLYSQLTFKALIVIWLEATTKWIQMFSWPGIPGLLIPILTHPISDLLCAYLLDSREGSSCNDLTGG